MGRRFVPREEWCHKNLACVEFQSPFVEGPNGELGIWEDDGTPSSGTYVRHDTPKSGTYVRHEWKESIIGCALFLCAFFSAIIALQIPFMLGLSMRTLSQVLWLALFALGCARYSFSLLDGRMQIIEFIEKQSDKPRE